MALVLCTNLHINKTKTGFMNPKKKQPQPKPIIQAANSLLVTPTVPGFSYEEYRDIKLKQINKALDESIPLNNQHPTILAEAMRYTILAGGKRITPTVCLASCEVVGGSESLAMPAACALEMMFTMSLVLDDLPAIDNDDFRRGKPANHKVFGEGTTIQACQSLLCLAIEKIASETINISSDRRIRAIKEMCTAFGYKGLAAGQVLDMQSEGQELSLTELEAVHRLKAGKLQEAAAVCGAIIGGGNEVEIEKLRNYGMLVGFLYQVCDDVLDVTGSVEKMGKKVGRDALRDKSTFVKLMGVDETKKYARDLVAQAFEELRCFDCAKAAPLYHIPHAILSFIL